MVGMYLWQLHRPFAAEARPSALTALCFRLVEYLTITLMPFFKFPEQYKSTGISQSPQDKILFYHIRPGGFLAKLPYIRHEVLT